MNKFFLLFFSILLGFLVNGQENAICSLQPDHNPVAAHPVLTLDSQLDPEDYCYVSSRPPERKTRKVRTRLRGITAFEIQPGNSPQQAAEMPQSVPLHMYVSNNALVCPFYYVFLFRLTPF
jgi:hypothetical protein